MSQLLLSTLAVVCPTCDGYNPPQSVSCQACGASLGARPAAAPPASARAPGTAPAPVASFAKPGEPPRVARPPETVPPGLRPSARTPPPNPTGLKTVPAAPAAARPAASPPAAAPLVGRALTPPAARGGMAPAAPAATAAPKFGLAVLAGTARGQRYKLPLTGCVVGRTRGALLLAEDPFVSPLHATFVVKEGALYVRDESSASGVYVTIAGAESLGVQGQFSVGQRLFRYTGPIELPPPPAGRPVVYGAPVPSGQALYGLEELLVGARPGRAVTTPGPLVTIGQANCDLSYPQDESLAGRHCELSPNPSGGATLRDLSGGLGTYVRIPPLTERPLRAGDRVRMGQHVLQVEALG